MIILIPLILWAIAQSYKFLTRGVRSKKFVFTDLLDTGGMPSSHSAMVSSLAAAIGVQEGWASPLFGVTVIFAMIVIHDAARLRMVVQTHSKLLNHLRTSLTQNEQTHFPLTSERVGHTVAEVIAGTVLGVIGGLVLAGIWVA